MIIEKGTGYASATLWYESEHRILKSLDPKYYKALSISMKSAILYQALKDCANRISMGSTRTRVKIR